RVREAHARDHGARARRIGGVGGPGLVRPGGPGTHLRRRVVPPGGPGGTVSRAPPARPTRARRPRRGRPAPPRGGAAARTGRRPAERARARRVDERGTRLLERAEAAPQVGERRAVEAGPDLAAVAQHAGAVVRAQEERTEPDARARRVGPARDRELLPLRAA